MSRPLKDEKALCSDVSTFINVAKSYQQQKRIVAKAQGARSDGAQEAQRAGTDKQRGSIWIVLKGGFSAPNASAKRQEVQRGFRERLRATKRERDAALEVAEEEEQGLDPKAAEGGEGGAEVQDEAPAETGDEEAAEAEPAEETEPLAAAAASRAPSKVPGEAFLEFLQRHGATVDAEGSVDQSEPTRCIVRVRSSRPMTAARTLPPSSGEGDGPSGSRSDPSELKTAKKRRRDAARKRRARAVRGLHRRSTAVLGSQKAVNYFKTNLLQILKREVQPLMAKSLAAPPAVSTIPFSDAAPLKEHKDPAPLPAAAATQKSPGSHGEKPRAEPHPRADGSTAKEVLKPPAPKEAEAKKAPPASGKTKAQLKAEQSAKQSAPAPSPSAKKGNAKKK